MRAGKDTGEFRGYPPRYRSGGLRALAAPSISHRLLPPTGASLEGGSGVPGLEFVSMGKLEMGSLEVGHSM